MLHRINQIIPDLDDFLLPPNAGRSSLNMRFAASTENTNLSMDLVDGMVELTFNYNIPAGDNKVVGAKEDFESQSVFFALWNYDADTDTNNHGIYRIKGGDVDLVISGAILDFQEDSDVSIAVIDGKLYFTDNHSQPKMVNIQKGINNLYPSPLEEWMITQIKRPPGLPLNLGVNGDYFEPQFLQYFSDDFKTNTIKTQTGIQFSYYYIYDNDEESRLSPWSRLMWYTKIINLQIPANEYNNYLANKNLVKRIVFVFRIGNNGIVYVIQNVANDLSFNGTYTIPDVLFLPKTAVSSDILNADFDTVPLKSVSNEIAQNRLNHGNYLIDYDNWNGLTLTLNVEKNTLTDPTTQYRYLAPFGRCWFKGAGEMGIELLDEYGRKITVINTTSFVIPEFQYLQKKVTLGGTPAPTDPYNFDYDQNNIYKVKYTITGQFPSWCKYWRIVYKKAYEYIDFYKTTTRLWTWWSSEGVDYLSTQPVGGASVPSTNGEKTYTNRGFAFILSSGEPFAFDSNEDQYIYLASPTYSGRGGDPPTKIGDAREYKISKNVGNVYFVEGFSPPGGWYYSGGDFNDLNNFWQALQECYLYTRRKNISQIFYQSTAVNEVGNNQVGYIYGDCYFNQFLKNNAGSTSAIIPYNNSTGTFSNSTVNRSVKDYADIGQYGVAMNPTNIYSQIWDSDIGQPNVVNQNQRQVRILQGIIFSDSLIQGTQINGLSKFNSVDNRQAPLENGPITALVRTSATQREPGVLLAIGENGVSSFYYDGIQLTNIDGTANVSTSDKYLASQRPLVGNYGAKKLRNICATPLGTVYYWSEGIQDWIRYTNAGLEQLGETYQFMNYLRNQLDSSTSVMMTYDQVTDEAIIVGNLTNAMVFSERFKTFQGEREYNQGPSSICPERGATLSTRTFFFLEGHVWQMTPNGIPNSFFGALKDPQLTLVTNEMPTVVKQWNSIKVIGARPRDCQVVSGSEEYPPLQCTIDKGWWINRKGDWDVAIRRDENSVGGVMNGKIMESRILISTFAWDATDFDKLNYIEVKSNKSIVQ
jgi:hypothetical protein